MPEEDIACRVHAHGHVQFMKSHESRNVRDERIKGSEYHAQGPDDEKPQSGGTTCEID
jgi:hypothetical protein